jgi:23S rRNA G2445 N2-methylase RlmL
MHKRGYRDSQRPIHKAALKETLAAALVMATGFPSKEGYSLCDPMCGSGTILVEAALIACDTAPYLVGLANAATKDETASMADLNTVHICTLYSAKICKYS